MNEAQNFVSWATDPARTNDELFTVELLIEGMRHRQDWPFRVQEGFEEMLDRLKLRKFNPAYRSTLSREEIELLQKRAGTVTRFGQMGGSGSDRSLRDLQALSFFTALEDINLTGDISDLKPLAPLERVKRMTLMQTGELNGVHPLNFAQCGEMPQLEYLFLSLSHSWPDLRAMANWPALLELRFHGNVLALAEVKEFPALEILHVNGWTDRNAQLRDLKTFPVMPKLKRLMLYSTASLEGIERYPSVLNLEIGGYFRDLEPLTSLPNVTSLGLTSEQFTELMPILPMPRLRELMFRRERPLDLSPLTDVPQLRRVEFERCAMMRTEVAALNMGLLPEAADFLADEPRVLGPQKLYLVSKENEEGRKFFIAKTEGLRKVREEFYEGDLAFEHAETRSFLTGLQEKLDELLGRGWGLLSTEHLGPPGGTHLSFKRYNDTIRIREIIQLLREQSSKARFPWHFNVIVEPHGDMTYEVEELKQFEEKMTEPERPWLAEYYEPESVLQENEEHRRMREEAYEIREREHLLQLQEQQSGAIDPELLLPPKKQAPPPKEEAEEEQPQLGESSVDANDEGGGVAIATPPPAPPDTPDLSDKLMYAIDVYEDCMVVNQGWEDRARYGLGEAPVEWSES